MAINDGTTTSARGFLGTVTGFVQDTTETTNGARSITKVKGEDNETAEVVIADPFVEHSINATVLATHATTYRIGDRLTYNSVNHCITAARRSRTPKFERYALTIRKETSMTYAAPA